jgi:hypothetical protein
MPSIKTGQILGLSSQSVNIEDKTYLSEYFNLIEFSPEFSVGKNSLVINGSDKLKIGAEILTEAFDSNGVSLFIEKAISTDQLTKKRIIVLSIYVYEQNSVGSGKIILVSTTTDNKTVRWTANINIDVNKVTDSKIRFYNQPLIEVEPILSYVVSSSVENNPKTITGNFLSNPVQPKVDFDIQKFGYRKNLVDYRITDVTANFSSSLKNFQVQLYINKIKEYASLNEININTTASFLIKDVLNTTTLILDTPFTYNNKVATITSGNYKIVYNDVTYNPNLFLSSSYLQESLGLSGAKQYKKISYAKIIYKNINTFTGKPVKHKVYRKSLRTLGDFESVIDETFGDTEILKDPVTPNKAYERLGTFFSQFHINNFWFTSSNDINLKYDNETFIDGLKISGSNLNGTYAIVKSNTSFTNRNPSYLPYNENEQLAQSGSSFDSNFLTFYKNTDYTLSFRTSIVEKIPSIITKLKFYITSSIPSISKNLNYDSNRGALIGEFVYSGSTVGKYFDQKQNFDFKFPEDLYGTLVIYPENVNQIIVSDISIKVSELYGFTGNSYYVKVPFPVNVANEVFEIKSELYDVNSNLSYTNLRTVQVFDPSGSSAPPDIGSSTVISVDILNVTSSIFWKSPCGVGEPASAFKYFLTWDDVSNRVCVMTSSAVASGSIISGSGGNITSIIGGPGVTIISGSGPIVTISASAGGTGNGFPFTGSGYVTGSLIVTGSISTYNITSSNLVSVNNILTYITASNISASNITSSLYGTSSWATNVVSSSYALTASYALNGGSGGTTLITGSTYPITSSWANNVISASYSLSSSYSVYALTSSYTILSETASYLLPQNSYFITNLSASGRLSSSNVNVGTPNSSYPWGNSMTGSYFSTWTSDTNVSDALRFFAGAFSASYPIPSPNTKTLSGISTINTNTGSTITINGRVPSGSTNQYINYLQPLGWATIGQTVFSGYTFRNAANYALYGSTVGGSTTISSSLGSNAFGLDQLNNGILNIVRLSGSFSLTFASSSTGTVNFTNNTDILISQSSDNGTASIATPIALRIIPSANMAVIPPIYQDGYFNNFTGSNLTNSISLSSVSSSGIYIISGYVGINSGSSTYSYFTGSNLTQYYTPLIDGNFTQTISSPGSTITASSIVTRSLSGAPYLTSGSSYIYTVTASNAFNPLYFNGTVSTTTIPSNALGLTTTNAITLTTNPTIQTANVVKSSDYTTTRTVGSYPFESDVIVFGVTMSAVGTSSTAASSGATITTFTVNNTTYNRAGSGTTIGSQVATIHTAGSFGIPSASGSLLYYGRPEGYTTGSLTFSTTPNTEQLLDEAYRMVLNDNLLNSSGSYFNSASYLPTASLQVKPGFLVNQGGANGYWYPSGYGTTYKYYVRYFKSTAVVNTLRITLTGNTTLVKWDETTSNSMAIGLIFESGNSNTYARCRLYDIANLANNIVSSSIPTSNLSTDGKNPFSVNIDLYGNNGSGASNSGGVINIPLRNVDGMTLDSTVASKDELYVIVRYNGSPTPLTSLKIEKSA